MCDFCDSTGQTIFLFMVEKYGKNSGLAHEKTGGSGTSISVSQFGQTQC
jgi:hypothetical protein